LLGAEYYAEKLKVFTSGYDESFTAIARGLTPWDLVILNPNDGFVNKNRVLPE
jgi:hypothetical protein